MPRSRHPGTVTVWARVPEKSVDQIERALPRYGWRTHVMKYVTQYLAKRLRPGTMPSMDTLDALTREALDDLVESLETRKAS